MDDRDVARFEALRDTSSGPEACWPWKRGTDFAGYGYMSVRNRHVRAHRIAYQLAKGPIPPGLTIDHLCRNRACANPGHLEAVTIAENVRRGAAARPARTHCKVGHALDEWGTTSSGACKRCTRLYQRRWSREKYRIDHGLPTGGPGYIERRGSHE